MRPQGPFIYDPEKHAALLEEIQEGYIDTQFCPMCYSTTAPVTMAKMQTYQGFEACDPNAIWYPEAYCQTCQDVYPIGELTKLQEDIYEAAIGAANSIFVRLMKRIDELEARLTKPPATDFPDYALRGRR